MPATQSAIRVSIRPPTLDDATAIHALIASAPPLELNSCYTYLLLCSHFADTCAVATDGKRIIGFLGGYRPPADPSVLFVWQVAVAPQGRGQGLGRQMMEHILARDGCAEVRWLEASVTPSNEASAGLFTGAAARWGVACTVSDWLSSGHFGAAAHEPERLFRIGPFQPGNWTK